MFSFDNKVTVELGETENQVVHHVSVRSNGAPMFLPNRLNANIGDQVKFRFHNINHTLTQSSLAEPCSSIGEFNSGFNQFNPEDKNNLVITLTVNSLDPQ
jgi:plastocyanin